MRTNILQPKKPVFLIIASFIYVQLSFSQTSVEMEVEANSLTTVALKKLNSIVPLNTNFNKKYSNEKNAINLKKDIDNMSFNLSQLDEDSEVMNAAVKADLALMKIGVDASNVTTVRETKNKLQNKLYRAKVRYEKIKTYNNVAQSTQVTPYSSNSSVNDSQYNSGFLNSIANKDISTMNVRTKNLIKTKYLQANQYFDAKNYSRTLEKIIEIEQLSGGKPMIVSQYLKVKALTQNNEYKKAANELYRLQGMNISEDLITELATLSTVVENKLQEHQKKLERAEKIRVEKVRDSLAWLKAVQFNSIDSYRDYLENPLNKKYTSEAKTKADELLWNSTTELKSKEPFERYSKEGINSNLIEKANYYLEYWDITSIDWESSPDKIASIDYLPFYVNVTSVNLSANNLTILPEKIGNLINTDDFNINDNNLIKLPSSIGNMTKLKFFKAKNNKINELSNEIGNLTNLEELNLQGNKLKELPKVFTKLSRLEKLNLSNNPLESLPENIGRLRNLEEFNLDNTLLTSLPESISEIKKLNVLYIRNTKLLSLPINITELSELRKIYIDKEGAKVLKADLKRLKKTNSDLEIIKD